MNCLEFRRLKLAEPASQSDAAQEHQSSCPGCAEFARKTDRFEIELMQAIAVPVPENLVHRVLLNHGLKRDYRSKVAGIAATLLLATGITFSAGYFMTAPSAELFAHTFKHVQGEPGAMVAEQKVAQGEMAEALARSGATLVGHVGDVVSYLHDCPVPGGLGKHIVMQTAMGKFTVITMPDQQVRRKGTMQVGGLVAAVMPVGKGSVAIVSHSPAALALAEQTLQQYVDWRA